MAMGTSSLHCLKLDSVVRTRAANHLVPTSKMKVRGVGRQCRHISYTQFFTRTFYISSLLLRDGSSPLRDPRNTQSTLQVIGFIHQICRSLILARHRSPHTDEHCSLPINSKLVRVRVLASPLPAQIQLIWFCERLRHFLTVGTQ